MNEHLIRQYDLVPQDILTSKIVVVGAGAVGSFTVLALAKMGFSDIKVIDFDKVDVVNMNSQFYRFSDIGKQKVVALQSLVHDFTGTTIDIVDGKYEGGDLGSTIVISAVDSMSIRKLIWDSHSMKSLSTKYFIDPRMGAEHAAIYVAKPGQYSDVKRYEKSLYSDDDSVQERCTAKATIYTAQMLSGLVAQTVKDCLMEKNIHQAQWSIKDYDFVSFKDKADLGCHTSETLAV